jgi:hypothetical protein
MRNGTNGGNGSSTRRPEEILAEIHRTRDEMDHTLQAIEHRLTPGQLVDQGLEYLKNSGAREYVSNLSSSVKTHPLPATLTGIGIAWLMAVGNKQPAQPSSYNTGPGIGDRMQSAKERASQIGSSARQQLERARGGWDSMLNEHPLALGAIGLAIGAMAPRTEKEDQLMGQARDDLLDKAKQAGTEKLEQMKKPQESFDSTKWPPSTRAAP